MPDRLSPAATVRLLRAKSGEHLARLQGLPAADWTELDYLAADLALIAGLLADTIDRLDGEA